MKLDEAIAHNLQRAQTIYPLECLDSLQGLDALRKLYVLSEEHARFTTVREAKMTVLNGVPVLITYILSPEEEELRKRMLEGSHGYWCGGDYYLTYKKRRKTHTSRLGGKIKCL